jgi:lipid-binding SYLF domain-containing protein
MKKWIVVVTVLVALVVAGCGPKKNLTLEERRQVVMDMEKETLARLYAESPETKDKVAKGAGYGVFTNANVNVVFVAAGGGYGVVVDNATGHRTYMKMAEGGVGLGLGAKDYRQVMIYKTKTAMDRFVESGWGVGANADAAAKTTGGGAEASGEGDLSSDIDVYSMTEAGLALQATVKGTKYWKDESLN